MYAGVSVINKMLNNNYVNLGNGDSISNYIDTTN